jgi:hypothetical protein
VSLGIGRSVWASAELSATTPVIDFHWNSDPADFNKRIVDSAEGPLGFVATGVGIGTTVPQTRLHIMVAFGKRANEFLTWFAICVWRT